MTTFLHGDNRRGKRSAEYNVWCSMRGRCLCQTNRAFADYGGRGITICKAWQGSFPQFLADMGRRPSPQHQLDRRDNDGPYSPENCRWATRTEQMQNTRHNVIVLVDGELLCLKEACRRLGVNYKTAHTRITRGTPPQDAVR